MQNKKGLIAIIVAIVVILVVALLLMFSSKKYEVSFDSNGGSAVASQTVKKNKTVERPADPVREGYTFAGWYLELTDTVVYDFSSKVTSDITLHAKWSAVSNPEVKDCTLTCSTGYTLDKDNCKCVKVEEDNPSVPSVVNVSKVTASKTSVSLVVGNSTKISLTISPSNATNKTVTWKSSNSKIATVDKNGNITAVAPGSAKVTATVDGKSVSITVTVTAKSSGNNKPQQPSNPGESTKPSGGETTKPSGGEASKPTTVDVKKVTVTGPNTGNVNSSIQLKANIDPENATNKTVTWKIVKGQDLATIDASGKLTATASGTVVVTATVDGVTSQEFTITINDVYTYSVEPYGELDQQVRVTVYKNNKSVSAEVERVRDANGASLGAYVKSTGYIMVDRNYVDAIKTIRIDGNLVQITKK